MNTSRLALMAGGAALGLLVARPRPRRRAGGAMHRVVVVGAGFGGLQTALGLAGKPGIDLTVIDAQNHHLFQPLLYQVATAALSPADIASPIRGILPEGRHVRVMMETVRGVDTAARAVECGAGRVPYDTLILATGSETSYFGNDQWAADAVGLKTLRDALELRRQVLDAFERALDADDAAERQRLLCFVLIGGGPTGVEMAGSIAELARDVLKHDEKHLLAQDDKLGPMQAKIILAEGEDSVLGGFTPDLRRNAARALQTLGVTLRLGVKVTAIEAGAVMLGDERVEAGTVIWTAGTRATPVADWLGVEPGKGGRVEVDACLRVPDRDGVFVIGDAALATGRDGKPLPGLAPVAKQQGHYLSKRILRAARGLRVGRRFSYRDYGTLATIGRNKAVAEFGPVHLTGFVAWLTWAVAHIFFLIGFRNRFMVSAQWAFAYATHERADRLIVERPGKDVPGRTADGEKKPQPG